MKAKFISVILFFFLLQQLANAQLNESVPKDQLTQIYTRAITDFIKDANQKNKTKFDTLYFGNRKDGDPQNDFPDIKLPETIENTQIRLISPEEGTIKQKERPTRIYINMLGWVDDTKADFLFYVFSNGFAHQYNYSINYKYIRKHKALELIKLEYKTPSTTN